MRCYELLDRGTLFADLDPRPLTAEFAQTCIDWAPHTRWLLTSADLFIPAPSMLLRLAFSLEHQHARPLSSAYQSAAQQWLPIMQPVKCHTHVPCMPASSLLEPDAARAGPCTLCSKCPGLLGCSWLSVSKPCAQSGHDAIPARARGLTEGRCGQEGRWVHALGPWHGRWQS